MQLQRYFIEMAYDGTAYHGWQRQPDAVTVQGTLEEKMSLLLRQTVLVTGAGRTDAGVHAKQMFAHCDLAADVSMDNFVYSLNQILPRDIAVYSIDQVDADKHARFDARARSYEYHFHLRSDPFYHGGSYVLHRHPDFGPWKKQRRYCWIIQILNVSHAPRLT